MAVEVSMKDMLDAGAHFGHQTRRWNPKMRPFIYGAKNGIHVINLQKTYPLLKDALNFISNMVSKGNQVLFVGTKPQAREVVKEEAVRAGMPFVTFRWLGGMLTNFTTIARSLQGIKELETMLAEGSVERLPKKEVLILEKRREKLLRNFEGIRQMDEVPKVMFVVDPSREKIAVTEARRLGVKTVAIVDTNCDPDLIDYPIPANDDAIKSIKLFVAAAAGACLDGKELHKQAILAGTDKAEVGEAANVEVIVRGKGPRRGRRPRSEEGKPEGAAAVEAPPAVEPATNPVKEEK